MVRRSKGYRSKTRKLLRKKPRERGKIGLSKILRNYEVGEKVCVKIDSSVHRGMPHRRFHGRIGVVKEKKGRAYVIKLKIGSKDKNIIVRPEHIKPIKSD